MDLGLYGRSAGVGVAIAEMLPAGGTLVADCNLGPAVSVAEQIEKRAAWPSRSVAILTSSDTDVINDTNLHVGDGISPPLH